MTSAMQLEGRVAVVTGGVSGMGRSMVLDFIEAGASVVAADMNQQKGQALVDEVTAAGHGDRIRFAVTNVASEPDVAAMIETAVDAFGRLDVLCNNAGIGGAFGPITDIEVEDWDETFHVLVRGVFLGCKHGARQMLAQDQGGSIINTASVAGLSAGGGPAAYSAAKAAVINFTQSMSLELARHRIRVNAICPGAIDTPLLNQGRKGKPLDAKFQPWPEVGQPEDIAATALFLASDASKFITGQAIVVDGGLTASGPTGWGLAETAPSGWVGMNRGTTGQKPTVRKRPT